MDIEDLERRAARAVDAMSEQAVRRIADGDATSIAIAFPPEQQPTEEDVDELRRLLHHLCRRRIAA